MSIRYSAVGWNRDKKIYDAVVAGLIFVSMGAFAVVALLTHREITAETLLIRGAALTSFVLLTLLLSIGPLARIDSRFLPLLSNRRHLGVAICGLALFHAAFAVFQFHVLGNFPARLSFLTAYSANGGGFSEIPFEPFGLGALVILGLLAATSHDFWLKNLGTPRWKKLHLWVYGAFGLLIAHVSLGLIQSERSPVYPIALGMALVWVAALHAIARKKECGRYPTAASPGEDGYQLACAQADLVEGRAKIVELGGKRVAIFLHQGQVRALSNVCRHQGGPLGEGRIIDGCVTCPWHGWQYRPDDGCSPPPFREVVPTFPTRVEKGQVFVDPRGSLASLPPEDHS